MIHYVRDSSNRTLFDISVYNKKTDTDKSYPEISTSIGVLTYGMLVSDLSNTVSTKNLKSFIIYCDEVDHVRQNWWEAIRFVPNSDANKYVAKTLKEFIDKVNKQFNIGLYYVTD